MADRAIKKESNGVLTKVVTIIGFLIMFGGAVWTASNTFAKQEDVKKLKDDMVQQVMTQQEILNSFKSMNQKFDIELNNLRIKILRDKISNLNTEKYYIQKKLLDNPNDAQSRLDLERVNEELVDVKTELRSLENE